ncbi:hypothetical protein ACFLXE_02915 [Chloroflexota bacterium]
MESRREKGVPQELMAKLIEERLTDKENPDNSIAYQELAEAVSAGVGEAIAEVTREVCFGLLNGMPGSLHFGRAKSTLTSTEMLTIGIGLVNALQVGEVDDLTKEVTEWYLEISRKNRSSRKQASTGAVVTK